MRNKFSPAFMLLCLGCLFNNFACHASAPATNVFDELAWRFSANAPIRSSITYSPQAVYFGSSKGIFYSLDKKTGKTNWTFNTGAAINSSAGYNNGQVFFSDNSQNLYCLAGATGKLAWKTSLGQSKAYDWAFDYYYSSPAVLNNQVVVGSKDGYVYNVNKTNGKVNWKFKTGGVVRSSPAISGSVVYVGDTDGTLFAISLQTGTELWHFYIKGHALKNENFGFDRRAIIAAPVVAGNKIIVGARDGFLYGIDKQTGKQLWVVDHEVSWVISHVAVKDTFVVTGTSDGRFVQAVNLNTGKQIWKFHTSLVWSSPVIDGDKVYVGSHQGALLCLDLKTGRKINAYQTYSIIFSSPVIAGNLLFFGNDDGNLYALRSSGKAHDLHEKARKYVYWEAGNTGSRYGTDVRVKSFLVDNGYTLLNKDKFVKLINDSDAKANSVVVIATSVFPAEIIDNGANSLLRKYLNQGGKVVVATNNPVVFRKDKDGQLDIRNFFYADTVLGIKYGPEDLRSYKGNQPAFPTKTGELWGLKKPWAAALSLESKQVDIVLGVDENGLASAWLKKYSQAPGSGFVQIWVDDNTIDMSYVASVAEFGLE